MWGNKICGEYKRMQPRCFFRLFNLLLNSNTQKIVPKHFAYPHYVGNIIQTKSGKHFWMLHTTKHCQHICMPETIVHIWHDTKNHNWHKKHTTQSTSFPNNVLLSNTTTHTERENSPPITTSHNLSHSNHEDDFEPPPPPFDDGWERFVEPFFFCGSISFCAAGGSFLKNLKTTHTHTMKYIFLSIVCFLLDGQEKILFWPVFKMSTLLLWHEHSHKNTFFVKCIFLKNQTNLQ